MGEKEIYEWFPLMKMEAKAFQGSRKARANTSRNDGKWEKIAEQNK